VTVALVAGLHTHYSMMKILTMAFWGEPARADPQPPRTGALAAAGLLVSFSITLAVAADPLWRFSQATAAQVLDTPRYVAAVLAPGGRP
jgi:formate hydrogenlyase subunit 3/multisubunit Na+/H+ antiporter MnhD subunit